MSPATARLPEPAPAPRDEDQRVTFHGVTWWQYEFMLAVRGESAVPRMSYLKGELELMSPSRSHERIKTTIARILEHWSMRHDRPFNGFGSWTLKDQPAERGAEPDECYVLSDDGEPERPDIAIEVNWSSGGIDKLEIYRGLGVREVWMWEHDQISVYALKADAYVRLERSELLPEIDVVRLAELATEPNQRIAARAFVGE